MRRLAPAFAVLLLAGCGVRPTGVVYAGEAPTATAPASPRSQVYFLLRDQPIPVERPIDPADTQAVFDSLLTGPTEAEEAKGVRTGLAGIKRIEVQQLAPRVLYVDVSPSGAALSAQAYAQIQCTGTMLPGHPIMKIALPERGAAVPFGCQGGSLFTPAVPSARPTG